LSLFDLNAALRRSASFADALRWIARQDRYRIGFLSALFYPWGLLQLAAIIHFIRRRPEVSQSPVKMGIRVNMRHRDDHSTE
jgi:hypothetical protein